MTCSWFLKETSVKVKDPVMHDMEISAKFASLLNVAEEKLVAAYNYHYIVMVWSLYRLGLFNSRFHRSSIQKMIEANQRRMINEQDNSPPVN